MSRIFISGSSTGLGLMAPSAPSRPASGRSRCAAPRCATAALRRAALRVLMILNDGMVNKQIAYELGVSEGTVKAHVSAILQKLGVTSRTQAVILVRQLADEADAPREMIPRLAEERRAAGRMGLFSIGRSRLSARSFIPSERSAVVSTAGTGRWSRRRTAWTQAKPSSPPSR